MRFGLIGYGAWGRQHAVAIEKAPGASVAAIACRTEASATIAQRDLPRAAVYLDYRRLLDRADIDAVDVVVPNHLPAEIGVAALERGKDVLLEKPMAPTLAECDRLIAAAGRSGRVLSIGHELRLSKQWGRVKALLDAGAIGEPCREIAPLGRRRGEQLGDDLSPIGDLNVLARAHQAHVFAEAILQLSKPDLLHGPNVASRGHIVNTRGRAPRIKALRLSGTRRRASPSAETSPQESCSSGRGRG